MSNPSNQKPRWRYKWSHEDRFLGQFKEYDIWLEKESSIWIVKEISNGKGISKVIRNHPSYDSFKEKINHLSQGAQSAFLHGYRLFNGELLDPSISPNAHV